MGRGLVMALVGTLWVWIAGVILSEAIGRTNWSPLSGMTLIAVTILIFISSGLGDTKAAVVSAIMVGAAACVAMSQATDLMLDLKTGYLVGATPRQQQLGQFLGAWLGPIVVIALIFVLHEAYVLGSDKLPAPQGQVLASMVNGIVGGDVPAQKYLAGAGLGALLSLFQPGLGITVGLGFYLPFNIVLTYSIGTLLRVVSDHWLGHGLRRDHRHPGRGGLHRRRGAGGCRIRHFHDREGGVTMKNLRTDTGHRFLPGRRVPVFTGSADRQLVLHGACAAGRPGRAVAAPQGDTGRNPRAVSGWPATSRSWVPAWKMSVRTWKPSVLEATTCRCTRPASKSTACSGMT